MRPQVNQLNCQIAALESSDASTREAAAHAIHDLGEAAVLAAPALYRTLLRETDACPWVGTALTVIGPLAPDLDILESALQRDNSHVRFWAARTAISIGPDAEPLIAFLIPLLFDENHPVNDSAVWALGAIGSAAVTALLTAARGDDAALRARSLFALGKYPDHATHKLPTIIESLDDPDADVRNSAAHAICSLGQSAHPNRNIYDAETFAMIVGTIERIAADSSFGIDADWFDRIRGWLRPDA